MYKKKIIGIALIAAMVSSMAAVSVSARDAFDDGERDTYFANHTIGIIGGFNEWASDSAKMYDEDGDGVFVGVVENVPAGEYEFKIRADEAWEDSWGTYEGEYDRTFNSQTNCKISFEVESDVIVMLDTNGEDEVLWPVSYAAVPSAAADFEDATVDEDTFGADHVYSAIGGFNDWGGDVVLNEIADGVYSANIGDLAEDVQFKVRADGAWTYSWGAYEAEYERTQNSQTNCSMPEDGTDVTVFFSKRGAFDLWPVAFGYTDADGVYKFVDTSVETTEEPDTPEPVLEPSRYGIVGTMTDWSSDIAMYETEAGIYVGKTDELPAGDYAFKVRADGAWTDSWGVYEEDYDRTYNSQTDVAVTLDEAAVITVKLDATSGSDEDAVALWPVSYKIGDGEWVYTGPEAVDPQTSETQESQVSQESQESQDSQVSEDSQTSVPVDDTSKAPEYYETKVTDYIYFDNSETKWEKVYAYWWHSDYARTYDLENNDWGIVKTVTETGEEGWEPVKFPGTEMTQIEGTDIWQARIPFGAQKIIFNSGKTDEQIWAGETGYQSDDLVFDEKANAGQVFKLDVSEAPKAGRGKEKTKLKYLTGAWAAYDGKFMSEQIGELPQVSEISTTGGNESQTSQTPSGNSQTPSGNSQTPSGNSQTPSGNSQTSTTGTTTPVVNTGDATMPIAVGAVAVMALGAAVIASKKKEQE